jgi:hypothetical protein
VRGGIIVVAVRGERDELAPGVGGIERLELRGLLA